MARPDLLCPGVRVVMTDGVKRQLLTNNASEHVAEFGGCIGVVIGRYQWRAHDGQYLSDDDDPTYEVRWMPSNLKYLYLASQLVVIDGP